MKKLALLFISVVILLAGCNKNSKYTSEDPDYMNAILMFNAITNQTDVALDPFSIAFRLNALLTEAIANHGSVGDNLENVSSTTQAALFGNSTQITYDPVEKTYEINYQGAANETDRLRAGKVYVYVGNSPTLEPLNTSWLVSTEEYDVSFSPLIIRLSFGINEDNNGEGEDAETSTYSIRTTGVNKWQIGIANLNGSSGTGTVETKWNGTYNIEQEEGKTQLPSDLETSKFYVSMTINNGSTMFLLDPLSVETSSPIVYNAACSVFAPVKGGKIRITANPTVSLDDYCTVEWVTGSTNACTPGLLVVYEGEEYNL